MAIKSVPWVSGYAKHDSYEVSSVESINMFPEALPAEGTKVQYIQRAIPGSLLWTELPASGICRGMHTASDGALYVCYGAEIYHVASDKTATSLLNIGTGSSKVSMASNGFVLALCDGQGLWNIDLTTRVASSVTTSAFTNPKQVVWFGNRFCVINNDDSYADNEEDAPIANVSRNNNKVFHSTLNKPEEYLALSSFSAEMGGDPITCVAVTAGELWVYGNSSFEPWRYTGNAASPFEKAQGAGGWVGCYSKDSAVSIGNNVFWLGSGKDGYAQIWTNGSTYEPLKISSIQIDQMLTSTRDKGITLTDAVGFSYSTRGHTFYVLSFMNANFTIMYDLTTQRWSQASSRHPLLGTQMRWNYMFSTSAYDKVFVADERNPYLMQLSMEVYDEYSNTADRLDIRRLLSGPVYWNDNSEFIINEFLIDMETGVGTNAGQGLDPVCTVRVSRTAGHTYNPSQQLPMGKVGEYMTTVRKRGLGKSKAFVIEWTCSDPVKTVILGARMDAEPTTKR